MTRKGNTYTLSKSYYKRLIIWLSCSLIFVIWGVLDSNVNFLFNAITSVVLSSAVLYVNLLYIMPRFLLRNRWIAYSIVVILLVVAILLITWVLHPWVSAVQICSDYFCRWLLLVVVVMLASTIYGYSSLDRISRKREIDLTHQNIEFEMKFLKSQINPHFLFNALNNIYALSVIKSGRTPDMILKLSDMLRFTLYDSESKKVKIGREIEYIVNYIEFQKLKMDSEPNIQVNTSNCNAEMLIEPMLLIPFIENSFKHGNIDNAKKGWLQVEVKTLGPILIFKVKNSLPAIAINKDVVGGIGVENVRKRLDILYPNRYELKIETTESAFSVYMKIDTFV